MTPGFNPAERCAVATEPISTRRSFFVGREFAATEGGQGGAEPGIGVVGDIPDSRVAAQLHHGLRVDCLDGGFLGARATADDDVAGQ